MIHKTIDLYDYCAVPRGEAKKGFLTVYEPEFLTENRPKIRPAMLVIAGGGYFMCSQRETEPIALKYASEGFAAFVLDYEVQTTHPTPLLQAAMAMKYIRENADTLRIDPKKVAAVGFSAGGHLLGSLCNRYDDRAIKELLGTADVKPDAAVYSYPVITMEQGVTHDGTRDTITGGDTELAEYLSIEKAVTKDAPPAFIWHTADDDCVPVANSLLLAEAYRKHSVPFELHIFSHGRHGLSLANPEVNDSTDGEGNLPEVATWFPLSLAFLKKRGFQVVTKE